MKLRRIVILSLPVLIILVGALIYLFATTGRTVNISGPLTAQDVVAIKHFVFRERAALASGHYAPYRLAVPVGEKIKLFWRNLREHAAGELRSIATSNGQAVVVEFGDRWNSAVRYEYYLRRTTYGWTIAGKVESWSGPESQANDPLTRRSTE